MSGKINQYDEQGMRYTEGDDLTPRKPAETYRTPAQMVRDTTERLAAGTPDPQGESTLATARRLLNDNADAAFFLLPPEAQAKIREAEHKTPEAFKGAVAGAIKQAEVSVASGATAEGSAPGGVTEASIAARLEEIRVGGMAVVDPKVKAEREALLAQLDDIKPQIKTRGGGL